MPPLSALTKKEGLGNVNSLAQSLSQIGNGKAGRALSLPASLRCRLLLLLPLFVPLLCLHLLLSPPMASSTGTGTKYLNPQLTPWSFSLYSRAGQGRGPVQIPGKRNCPLLHQGCWSPGQRQRSWGLANQRNPLGDRLQEQRAQVGVWYQAGHAEETWACFGMRIGAQNVRAEKTLKTSQSYCSFCNWGN